MRKLFSSNLFAAVGLVLIVWVTLQISVASFDKHMYEGVDVIKQDGNVLFVTLDKPYTLGTDTMCLEAVRIIKQVARQTGCYIQVVTEDDQWAPLTQKIWEYEELKELYDEAASY